MEDLRLEERRALVAHVRQRGVHDERVLDALLAVPRERFVEPGLGAMAYRDAPLPIGGRQTISQPTMVGIMVQALAPGADDRVLEVGAGSGYAAAVLARLAGEVYAVERLPELAQQARERLRDDPNVHVIEGDGSRGIPELAPFDAILVSAAAPEVPDSLRRQLKVGGRLVVPVGRRLQDQRLVCVRRTGEEAWSQEDLGPVRFVRLVGAEGWGAERRRDRPRRQARAAPHVPPPPSAQPEEAAEASGEAST